ncbi:MAG: DUF1285 domain-containing protein [Candidatus Tectomicrobia bacterium]|uniref:DUF1285 domain-containing protein n=1 Tax=Tectimicrobiota bacterium TaxID=2528274 RepID=A0A932G1P5_UNCTE|nr:DUF1285 domain-containing protein [Candidatus Tectomicrobia bacterium]
MESPPPCLFRIDREGNWYHEGVEVTHRRIYLYLYRLLQQEKESGRFFIQNEEGRWSVEVEDAPFVVTHLEPIRKPPQRPSSTEKAKEKGESPDSQPEPRSPSGEPADPAQFVLTLNDETQELLDPTTLWLHPENIPYCQVKGGRFQARFNLSSYFKLAEWLQYDEERDGVYLPLAGGERHYLASERGGPGHSAGAG